MQMMENIEPSAKPFEKSFAEPSAHPYDRKAHPIHRSDAI